MTFSMSVVDKSARLALEAEDEENALSSKVVLRSKYLDTLNWGS